MWLRPRVVLSAGCRSWCRRSDRRRRASAGSCSADGHPAACRSCTDPKVGEGHRLFGLGVQIIGAEIDAEAACSRPTASPSHTDGRRKSRASALTGALTSADVAVDEIGVDRRRDAVAGDAVERRRADRGDRRTGRVVGRGAGRAALPPTGVARVTVDTVGEHAGVRDSCSTDRCRANRRRRCRRRREPSGRSVGFQSKLTRGWKLLRPL